MEEHVSSLRKFVAPEFIFGPSALKKCAEYVKNFGAERILLVSDDGVAKAGWTGKVEAALKEAGVVYELFLDVSPNPRADEVMKGADYYSRAKCDMLLSVGGGSPIDCAKGIGIVVSNHRHILDFEGVDNVPIPMPPLLCIPTTAGSSADVSQFAIILDADTSSKIAIVSKGVVPDISLIDPETTHTMDQALSAETGLDALTHAIEAYVSNAASAMTNMHALEAIRYICRYLPTVIQKPQDSHARAGVMMGSLLAGLAFSNASLGLVHSMAHALGGVFDLPHGLCNALLLEHVIAFNFEAVPDRYRVIASLLTGKALSTESQNMVLELLTGALVRLRRRVHLGETFGVLKVDATMIRMLSERAMSDVCMVTNPRPVKREDIEGIYGCIF
jgi:alcohol dehydrogenase class IV